MLTTYGSICKAQSLLIFIVIKYRSKLKSSMINGLSKVETEFNSSEELARIIQYKAQSGASYEELAEVSLHILSKLNSFNTTFLNEEGRFNACMFVFNYAKALGMEASVYYNQGKNKAFHLVIAKNDSKLNLEELDRAVEGEDLNIPKMNVFHAHLDVVPINNNLGIERQNGVVIGRGTNDVLAQASLLMVNMALNPECNVVYYFSGDEEVDMKYGGIEIIKYFHGFLFDFEPTGNVLGEVVTRGLEGHLYFRDIDPDDSNDSNILNYLKERGIRYKVDEENTLTVIVEEWDSELIGLLVVNNFFSVNIPPLNINNNPRNIKIFTEIVRRIYGEPIVIPELSSASKFKDGGLDNFISLALKLGKNGLIFSFPEVGERHSEQEAAYFHNYVQFLTLLDELSEYIDEFFEFEQ